MWFFSGGISTVPIDGMSIVSMFVLLV